MRQSEHHAEMVIRMIGSSVRSLYEKGKGFPCFVSVEQDGSGSGLATALALSRAIGATKAGAIASSAREETAMDLFAGSLGRFVVGYILKLISMQSKHCGLILSCSSGMLLFVE